MPSVLSTFSLHKPFNINFDLNGQKNYKFTLLTMNKKNKNVSLARFAACQCQELDFQDEMSFSLNENCDLRLETNVRRRKIF